MAQDETNHPDLKKFIIAVGQTISAATIIMTSLWFITKPLVEPYLILPTQIESIIKTINELDERSNGNIKPKTVDTLGVGLIHKQENNTLTLVYMLKRNVSCEGRINVRFWNVEGGYFAHSSWTPTIKSAIIGELTPFKIDIPIPETLKNGNYIYAPVLHPIDCGVYGVQVLPPSEIFEVKR